MLPVSLLLLPLLVEGALLGDPACPISDASTEDFNITTAEKTWYQHYQYTVPGAEGLGCLVVTQTPGASDGQINFNGIFSKLPLNPVNTTVTFDGNRLNMVAEGVWDKRLTGPINVVYADEDIFIDRFCLGGTVAEAAFILTTSADPSEELLDRIWKIVDEHPEVDRTRFVKVDC